MRSQQPLRPKFVGRRQGAGDPWNQGCRAQQDRPEIRRQFQAHHGQILLKPGLRKMQDQTLVLRPRMARDIGKALTRGGRRQPIDPGRRGRRLPSFQVREASPAKLSSHTTPLSGRGQCGSPPGPARHQLKCSNSAEPGGERDGRDKTGGWIENDSHYRRFPPGAKADMLRFLRKVGGPMRCRTP